MPACADWLCLAAESLFWAPERAEYPFDCAQDGCADWVCLARMMTLPPGQTGPAIGDLKFESAGAPDRPNWVCSAAEVPFFAHKRWKLALFGAAGPRHRQLDWPWEGIDGHSAAEGIAKTYRSRWVSCLPSRVFAVHPSYSI